MRLASNFWIFLLLPLLLFNCATIKPEATYLGPSEKAYVLIRTEGNEKEINQLTGILNSEFRVNSIGSDIFHYPLGMPWNNDQIFSTAYDNNYDYIVLIDQVAKFSTDDQTKVGGKYQIRSYSLNSSNPDWIDQGEKTFNISVTQSVEKFSKQIISSITTKTNSLTIKKDIDKNFTDKQRSSFPEIDYNQLKSSEEIDIEIAELKKQLEIEKEKTEKAIAKRERLEKDYQEILSAQKEKNQVVLEGLNNLKKERELAEAKRLEEVRLKDLEKREQEEKMAEAKRQEEKRIEEAKLAKLMVKEEMELKELAKQAKSEKQLADPKVPKEVKKELSVPTIKRNSESNALIILRGSDENSTDLKNLQDNLEFELLFANIKATTEVYYKEKTLNKKDVLKFNQPNYKYLILIDQLEENDEGATKFNISVVSSSYGNEWHDLDEQYFDLKDKNSLKKFSKFVLKSL